MREDKLSIQSMDFAVDIINLVKELKSKKKVLFQIKSEEAEHQSVQTFVKHIMLTEQQILSQSFKLLWKSQMKQDIG